MNSVQKQEIIERRAKGESLCQIAVALHVSKTTVINCVKENSHLIKNAVNLEKDAFLSRMQMTATKRVEHKIELMKKISDELLNRDLSKVPAEKLLGMLVDLEEKMTEGLRIVVGEFKLESPLDSLLSMSASSKKLVLTDV